MHTSYAYIYDKQKKRYHIQSNLFIKTKSSIIRMEEILVFTPLVFILIYLFIKKGFEYEINLPNRFVRFFLLAEKIIAIGLLVLIIGLYFQIRIFGFEGNKTYFYFAYFSLLLTRPIVERSNLSEIEKKTIETPDRNSSCMFRHCHDSLAWINNMELLYSGNWFGKGD